MASRWQAIAIDWPWLPVVAVIKPRRSSRRGSGLPGAPRSGAVSSISIAGPSTRLPPMLIVLSGLPGTGKTTIAREVARAIAAVYLRIDSIEQVMAAAGWRVEGEGYAVA